MLLSFSIENVFSFKERVTLDFRASGDINSRWEEATAPTRFGDQRALRVVGVYGANASGKSNLCMALRGFFELISHSTDKTWMDEHTMIVPFFFERGGVSTKPSRMELVFAFKGRNYRYGFEFFRGNFTKEWLFVRESPAVEYSPILMRKDIGNGQGMIEFDVDELVGIPESMKKLVRHDSLMLSLCRNFNIPLAVEIIDELSGKTYMGSTLRSDANFTAALLFSHSKLERQIQEFVRQTDPVIRRIVVKERKTETGLASSNAKRFQIRFEPAIGAKRLREAGILFGAMASAGTQKAFEMAGPIFQALANGGRVVIDEFGSAMHPLLSQSVIRLFNCKETNPNDAQLLFVTHDSNLLVTKVMDERTGREELLLRPDQIAFVERQKNFSSTVYSQSEFSEGNRDRRHDSREERYLAGQFGAIPFFSDKSGAK